MAIGIDRKSRKGIIGSRTSNRNSSKDIGPAFGGSESTGSTSQKPVKRPTRSPSPPSIVEQVQSDPLRTDPSGSKSNKPPQSSGSSPVKRPPVSRPVRDTGSSKTPDTSSTKKPVDRPVRSMGPPKEEEEEKEIAKTSQTSISEALDKMPDSVDVQSDESMTSAGRLNQMLQSDSPLMQRAKTQGMQTANKRGLLNSSMAAGAAQGAMIDRAQPFALQDSGNLMQNARQNAGAENKVGLLQSQTLADSALQSQQFGQQMTLNEQQAGFQEERDKRLSDLETGLVRIKAEINEAAAQNDLERQKELNRQSANLQEDRDELLFEQGLDELATEYGLRAEEIEQEGEQAMQNLYGTSLANAWGVMGNNVTDIVAQSMIEINDIQSNPNIEADDKTKMIDQIKEARDSDVEFQAELYSTLPDTLQNTNVFPDSVG